MHKLIPTLCAIVCVAVIGAMMTHGVSDLRHDVSHAASEHPDHIGHDHDETPPDIVEDAVEPADLKTPSGTAPVGHHHHGGGDIHAALPGHQGGVAGLVNARTRSRTVGVGRMPDGLLIEGPEHPPKQLRLIA